MIALHLNIHKSPRLENACPCSPDPSARGTGALSAPGELFPHAQSGGGGASWRGHRERASAGNGGKLNDGVVRPGLARANLVMLPGEPDRAGLRGTVAGALPPSLAPAARQRAGRLLGGCRLRPAPGMLQGTPSHLPSFPGPVEPSPATAACLPKACSRGARARSAAGRARVLRAAGSAPSPAPLQDGHPAQPRI